MGLKYWMHLAVPAALIMFVNMVVTGPHLQKLLINLIIRNFLKVSFDNLNYKIKFAKEKLGDSESGGMLNLITGQAVFSTIHPIKHSFTKTTEWKITRVTYIPPYSYGPAEIGKPNNQLNANIIRKLDAHYEGCTLNQLRLLQGDFCKILTVTDLKLCRIEQGYLQLILQIPWFIPNLDEQHF